MYALIISRSYPTQKYQLGIFEFDLPEALHVIGCKVNFTAVNFKT